MFVVCWPDLSSCNQESCEQGNDMWGVHGAAERILYYKKFNLLLATDY
jgi:hypothetical protein